MCEIGWKCEYVGSVCGSTMDVSMYKPIMWSVCADCFERTNCSVHIINI